MYQRVHFITLGVYDLEPAQLFYIDGLGWEPLLEVPGEVLFFQVGPGLVLSLFTGLDADMGNKERSAAPLAAPLTLSCNVDTEDEAVELIDRAAAAGAAVIKPAQRAAFGGFHGYISDPYGFRWEVAHNPGFSVAPDGTVVLVPVE